jgi:8-oxo-dGTP pyrophosphatase MutT (NUDIX family)
LGKEDKLTDVSLWFDDYHTHAAAGVFLLTDDSRLVLQLRDDIPGIHYPGMIATFGGAAEPGETAIACALRELAEETGLTPRAEDLELLGATSRVDYLGHPTASVFFLLRGIDPGALTITEGAAIVLGFAEAGTDPRLTENCRRFSAQIAAGQNVAGPA